MTIKAKDLLDLECEECVFFDKHQKNCRIEECRKLLSSDLFFITMSYKGDCDIKNGQISYTVRACNNCKHYNKCAKEYKNFKICSEYEHIKMRGDCSDCLFVLAIRFNKDSDMVIPYCSKNHTLINEETLREKKECWE